MTDPHPLIALYANTLSGDEPLILIVGREPNCDAPMGDHLGVYDFRTFPRCAFWNTAYGIVAHVLGVSVREFKALCEERRASPIVFTDVQPQGIINSDPKKHATRVAATPDAIAAHVRAIMACKAVIARVELCVMAGIDGEVFKQAADGLKSHLANKGVDVIHVPFLYPTNTAQIRLDLGAAGFTHVRDIAERFFGTPSGSAA